MKRIAKKRAKPVIPEVKESPLPKMVNITLPFKLCDFSESLSYDDVSDTLMIIGKFLDSDETGDYAPFHEEDLAIITGWFERNDIEKFLKVKEAAMNAHIRNYELEEEVRDIMSYPTRRPMSH